MSSKSAPASLIPSVDKFTRSLGDSKELLNLVRQLLDLPDYQAHRLLGATTSTGFRRIHEHLSSAIDRALEVCTVKKSLDDKSVSEIALLIMRGLILVNYQEARRQLNKDLADRLKAMIEYALDVLRTERDVNKVRGILESMGTLVDALAVLVYKHTR